MIHSQGLRPPHTRPYEGLVDGAGGGAVFVFGQATFAFATNDEVGRRLAAVQSVTNEIARRRSFPASVRSPPRRGRAAGRSC
jgi:hypothetical protein